MLTKLRLKEEAELVARSLLETLSTLFQIENHEITISASIGVSMFPENSTDADLLLQRRIALCTPPSAMARTR